MAPWPKTDKRVVLMAGMATPLWCVLAGLLPILLLGNAHGAENALKASRGDESATLRFLLRGKPQSDLAIDNLIQIAAPSIVRVFEPYEAGPVEFHALPFNAVLDAVYGKQWRLQEEVLLTCADGYQPGFPVRRLLDHKAWLAFDRADSQEFSILKLESGERRRIDLSPYYLIWDNYNDPELRLQGDYGWPYQLIGVDLIRAQDRFPKMTPGTGASSQVQAGFTSFRIHCTRCHAINGEGGSIGPELNLPVNPVEYREAKWLRQWIDDPGSLIATARMPALNKALPDRDQVIDDILAYLGAISQQKIPPETVKQGES